MTYKYIHINDNWDGQNWPMNTARQIALAQQAINDSDPDTAGNEFVVWALPISPRARRVRDEDFTDSVETSLRMNRQ